MLRTTVAIHPAGGGEPHDLAQLMVAQIRRGAGDLADYVWWLYEPPSPYSPGIDRAGVVAGWDRMQPAAALVARCMTAAFEDPQAFEEALPPAAATVVERWRAKAPRPQARQDDLLSTIVRAAERMKDDPLGYEGDLLTRLRRMAEDAVAGRHAEEVRQEAEVLRKALKRDWIAMEECRRSEVDDLVYASGGTVLPDDTALYDPEWGGIRQGGDSLMYERRVVRAVLADDGHAVLPGVEAAMGYWRGTMATVSHLLWALSPCADLDGRVPVEVLRSAVGADDGEAIRERVAMAAARAANAWREAAGHC